MIHSSIYTRLRAFIGSLLLSAGLSVPIAHAQKLSAEDQAAAAAYSQMLEDGAALARSGDYATLEQYLQTLATSEPGTVAWSMEMANRLKLVGDEIWQTGEREVMTELGRRALAHLADAERQVGRSDPRRLARIKEEEGRVNESLGGTRQAALDAYRAAAQLDPDLNRSAKAVDRLERVARRATSTSKEGN